jgi:hypothetical protein
MNVKGDGKDPRETGDSDLKGVTPVDLLRRLWNVREKKPRDEESPLDAKTDIYSLPPTSRRIPQRPRPLK